MDAQQARRIGVAVALAPVVALAPFLVYAGIAIAYGTAEWIQPMIGESLATLAGDLLFVVYLAAIFGIPASLGGLVGSWIGSSNWMTRDRGGRE
jgi:hypothetical protein